MITYEQSLRLGVLENRMIAFNRARIAHPDNERAMELYQKARADYDAFYDEVYGVDEDDEQDEDQVVTQVMR